MENRQRVANGNKPHQFNKPRNRQAKLSPPSASVRHAPIPVRVPKPRSNGPVKALHTTHGIVLVETAPLTHKQHRAARKAFKKRGNVPYGYRLIGGAITLQIDGELKTPPASVAYEWEKLDEASVGMFGRKYFKLKDKEKSKLHEVLNRAKETNG